jgi:pimeloyl-ACP methyl ester carboxylesterase
MNKSLIILATLLSGGSFWIAREAVNDLPDRVDVGGRLLRMRALGEGAPAVILEIGIGGPLEEWELVQPEIARFTKVVSYDRVGAVELQSKLTGQDVCRELHAALQKTGIKPPYVLVGQSLGGMYNRTFASLYPNEVVGMVLLDPTQEAFIDWMKLHHPKEKLSPELVKSFATAAGFWDTIRELKSMESLPSVPVTVVTATKFINDPLRIETLPIWTASHAKWVKSLPQGRHVLAPESGHGVQVEKPDLVIQLIRETVEQVRAKTNLHQPAQK